MADFHILVCNDDGLDAPGIRYLIEAMAGCGRVSVAAPSKDYSGASSSLTLRRSVAVRDEGGGVFRIDGTPSDCVHLALTGQFLTAKPDLIVAGINDGSNLGDDTIYSGTVAAAIEGHLFGVPGFAFSMVGRSGTHFAAAAAVARRLVENYRQRPVAGAPLWNVNIPDVADADAREIMVTRLGRRHAAQAAVLVEQQANGEVYCIGEAGNACDKGPGTDFCAVERGCISLTPLMVDLTDTPQIPKLQEWLQ